MTASVVRGFESLRLRYPRVAAYFARRPLRRAQLFGRSHLSDELPYKIAVLVYVFNSQRELLLLHRARPPNQHLYSPIGGKLEQAGGESPYACALREAHEEIGIALALEDIRLLGMVSEKAHEGQTHWLMFCFEVLRPLDFPPRQIEEGRLEWAPADKVAGLNIPSTDRAVIWPLVRKYSLALREPTSNPPETFSVHIDCTDPARFAVTQEHPPLP